MDTAISVPAQGISNIDFLVHDFDENEANPVWSMKFESDQRALVLFFDRIERIVLMRDLCPPSTVYI